MDERPRKPNRSYTAIVQQLFAAATGRLEQERHPEFLPDPLTDRMVDLHHRWKNAQQEIHTCEAALKRLGVQPKGEDLVLPYDRRRQLEMAWNAKHTARLKQLTTLKLQASIDLLDMDPAAAKRYLRTLQTKLAKLACVSPA